MEYRIDNTKTVYLNIHAVIPTNFSNYCKWMYAHCRFHVCIPNASQVDHAKCLLDTTRLLMFLYKCYPPVNEQHRIQQKRKERLSAPGNQVEWWLFHVFSDGAPIENHLSSSFNVRDTATPQLSKKVESFTCPWMLLRDIRVYWWREFKMWREFNMPIKSQYSLDEKGDNTKK